MSGVRSRLVVSGAWSGAWVVLVDEINVFSDGVGTGFWTEDEEDDGSVGQGDSGGPVVEPGSSGTRVVALGMIDQGTVSATCEGVAGGRQCFSWAFHVDIDEILDELDYLLQTD